MQIGDNLKAKRKSLGLSLRAAAEKIGISHAALFYIEGNTYNPRYNTLSRISDFYKLTFEELFGGPENGKK